MINIYKVSLIFIGGILIGFGIGIIFGNFLISEGINYWLAVIVSLVFGGFLLALGLMTKKNSEEKTTEPEKEKDNNPQNSANL
ncbi:MAG: hypothetical protein ABIG40_00235 [Parcubacteria group bacterium]